MALYTIGKFLKFYWKADTKYRIHSPFVFSLIEQVIEDKRSYYDFARLNHLKNSLELDQTLLDITDLGAGSKLNNKAQRKVASIAKSAVSPTWQGEFLFRLVHHLQVQNRLELGTSLGLSALYQYLPIKNAPLYTIEGCPNIAKIAAKNFKKFDSAQLYLNVGSFAELLPKVLKKIGRLDYVFIDGHHQLKPTLSYFEQCLEYSHEQTVFVFDDIHWSAEMDAAWEAIKLHPRVRLSIDLFHTGLVFLRTEQVEKQHFNIVPTKWKPWIMGFFS